MRGFSFILALLFALASGAAHAQTNPGTSPLSIAKGGTAAANTSSARTNLGLAIGVNVQAFNANLAAISGLTTAADKLAYWTGSGAAALADLTAFSRSVLANGSAPGWRTTLGLAIGTNVEAWDADLDCLAALSSTGTLKRTGAGTCSAGAIALSDLATGTQDTLIGYFGATTASAAAIPNCANALIYSTTTHTFGCNSTAGTGTVTNVVISAGTGISVSGTCNSNVSVSCAVALANNSASLQASPTAVNAGSTAQMMGFGSVCKITPAVSGRVRFRIFYNLSNNTNGNSSTYNGRYGTGAAPVAGAAQTGTGSGLNSMLANHPTANMYTQVDSEWIVSGLALGTQVWFDAVITASANTSQTLNPNCVAQEF